MDLKLISWNVNGLRSVLGKGLGEYIQGAGADVICLQEIKARPDQVDDLEWARGYEMIWNPAVKAGYSGTLVMSKAKPLSVQLGFGIEKHDQEGRVITAEYEGYYLVNVYTPNSQNELARLDYRVGEWDVAFRDHVSWLQLRKPVVFCGDLNVAHEDIDIARPEGNRRSPGFTDEERGSFSKLLEMDFVDSFRDFEKGPGHYSWWSFRANSRARNVGWRIDYVCVSEELRSSLKGAFIETGVMGSDHCPVGVILGSGN